MKNRIVEMYKELEFILNHSPAEEDCTEKENKMYSDIANLKSSIEDAVLNIGREESKKTDNSSRINRINTYKDNEEFLKLTAEQKLKNEASALISRIQALKPRIEELLAIGNACLKNGISMTGQAWGGHEGYDTNQFFTNSWSHLVGFVGGTSEIEFLGINAGGACGPWNFRTDGVKVFSVSGATTKEPEIGDMKKFLNKFDEFESSFYAYVDKVIDKQQKTVDSVIAEAKERSVVMDGSEQGTSKDTIDFE